MSLHVDRFRRRPLRHRVMAVASVAVAGLGGAAGQAAHAGAAAADAPASEAAPATAIPAHAGPPAAAVRPHPVTSPNGTRNDDYYWLRDDTRQDPQVLAYLHAENDWYAQYKARLQPLEDTLYAEIRGRVKENDATVPYALRGDSYATRFAEGKEYPIHVWHRGSPDAPEEVLLDVNELAQGKSYCAVADVAVSQAKDLLAYAEDTTGRRQYVIHVKDLKTGRLLPDELPGTSGSLAWAADDRTLFYVENDATTLRSRRVKRHVLGTPPAQDVVVHDEADEAYYTTIDRSSSQQWLVIGLQSTESDEQRVLRVDDPLGRFAVIAPRRPHFHYHADHIGRRWVVSTDWQAPNYRMMQVDDGRIGDRARWKPLVAHDPRTLIERFALFDDYLVLDERGGGLHKLRVLPWKDGALHGSPRDVQADEPAYAATLGRNEDEHTTVLRYTYTSLTTPETTYDLDMATGQRTLRKRQPVEGGYDPALYVTERVWVRARDGRQVPVSLVRRKDTKKNGTAPLYLYAYGSYGLSTDPTFRSGVLSLLDRGFVYAIAHVRGGEEMGRAWYEDGKKLHKRNTFTDFIDCTQSLVAQGYGDGRRVFAMGGSAGGLLMGAIANLQPQLYRGIVAHVPFVDVVTTMLDESIPLTTNEFDEWGNPKQRAYYDYMLAYSPYDNVRPHPYPAMLVTTGLVDSQVQYYEPAKWVARLRASKHEAGDDASPLLFKINMEAGHGGRSGRFARLREVAEEYAFVVDLAGSAR